MIRIQLYKSGDDFLGFECKGHAGADDGEYDLICNSVSVLTINTANAIESLTETAFSEEENPEGGYLKIMLSSPKDHDAQLLIKAMVLGLEQIAGNYPDYLRIQKREVNP